jgi:hypothetical protein
MFRLGRNYIDVGVPVNDEPSQEHETYVTAYPAMPFGTGHAYNGADGKGPGGNAVGGCENA